METNMMREIQTRTSRSMSTPTARVQCRTSALDTVTLAVTLAVTVPAYMEDVACTGGTLSIMGWNPIGDGMGAWNTEVIPNVASTRMNVIETMTPPRLFITRNATM